MNIKFADSWGYKINNTWNGVVRMLISGEIDLSIFLAAMRTERYEVVDYLAVSTWKHE